MRSKNHPFFQPATVLRVLPTTVLVAVAFALAWSTSGSINASDWLSYALVVAGVLAVVLVSGHAVVPERFPLLAAALLAAFGLWTAISIAWSPLPSNARDDALLCLLYAGAFLVPVLTLKSQADRLLATVVVVVLGLGVLAVATLLKTHGASNANVVYMSARLDFPVSYWNGAAALFLIGTWPAIALSADRRLGTALRALSLGAATAMVTCWLMTQSKGGAVALAVSAVVFLIVTRERLRALVPTAVVGVLAAVGADALTKPYRVSGPSELSAIHDAGNVALALTGAAVVAGIAFVQADRRLSIPEPIVGRIGRGLAAVFAVVAAASVLAFVTTIDHPIGFVQARWASFKQLPTHDTASSHFTSLGSSRYDYWRVALLEFDKNPIVGMGGHGWPAAYLRYGRTIEEPERSHSVELDALSETGIIGFLLLVGSGLLGLAAVARRRGAAILPAALFASGVYFAVHTAIDWVWSIPSVGLAALLLTGIGASRGGRPVLSPRIALAGAGAVGAVALLGFLPPWLSARFTDSAYGENASAQANSLSWAKTLDPLSVDPLLTQAALARGTNDIPPLRAAVRQQPGDAEVHFLLGIAYLNAHRLGDARAQLEIAQRLSPHDAAIADALRRAGVSA
ncbi:MAG TPA: O-antigen ligase family protein [Gaiellaceae bacterium]|jgi:O-antigen ligase|nr:O-antigen ligase family protein [Gaiellaceae bacterium]